MTTYIAPIGHGMGDLIVSLPAVQYLVSIGEPTVLVVRSPRQEGLQELIPGLSGAVREIDLLRDGVPDGARYVNLRAHPLQTDHVWGSEEFESKYPGYRIADIVSGICQDFGIRADFKNLQPLPFSTHEQTAGKIIFIPGSGGQFKCWPKEHWLDLHRRVSESGFKVIMLGEPEVCKAVSELIDCRIEWLATPHLRDAIDALSSAAAVVSVDTGLMHLALQQGKPVVALYINNPGSLNYMRTVENCFALVSPRCQKECVSEELDRELNRKVDWQEWCWYEGWTCHAQPQNRCMNQISAAAVFSRFNQALAELRYPALKLK